MRDAEIGELPRAGAGGEDVGRLDVAMDDARVMRGGERARDLDAERDQLVGGQRRRL